MVEMVETQRDGGGGQGVEGGVSSLHPPPSTPRPWWLALLALAATASGTAAQSPVRLELRPTPGDTIRMRVEQETEVLGQRPGVEAPQRMTMAVRLWSRAVIEGRLRGGTSVLTITDSVRLTTTDPRAQELAGRTARALTGRVMRLRLGVDGTARVIGGEGERELSALVSAMPAAFPAHAVSVGDHWRREMPVPAAPSAAGADGVIRAVFRLDSLTRDGALAWITVKGEMSGEAAMTGTVAGALVLDRRRGWLDDARFVLAVQTSVVAPGTAGMPMQVVTRIRQHMRAEPARGGRPAKP